MGAQQELSPSGSDMSGNVFTRLYNDRQLRNQRQNIASIYLNDQRAI